MSAAELSNFYAAFERLKRDRPRSVEEARWWLAIEDAATFLEAKGYVAARFGWSAEDLFAPPCGDGPSGLIWRICGGVVVYVNAASATIERSATSVSVVRRPSQLGLPTHVPDSRELEAVFGKVYGE